LRAQAGDAVIGTAARGAPEGAVAAAAAVRRGRAAASALIRPRSREPQAHDLDRIKPNRNQGVGVGTER